MVWEIAADRVLGLVGIDDRITFIHAAKMLRQHEWHALQTGVATV